MPTRLHLTLGTNAAQAMRMLWMRRESSKFMTRMIIAAKEILFHVLTFPVAGNALINEVKFRHILDFIQSVKKEVALMIF